MNGTYRVSFIGTGNMGAALARGIRAGLPKADLYFSNRSPEKALALAAELDGQAADNITAAQKGDFLFLGVKPDMIPRVIEEIRPAASGRPGPPVLVSMAAGVPLETLEQQASGLPVIRIMPNTPVAIGQGVTLYTCGQGISLDTEQAFREIMAGTGQLIPVREAHMEAGGVVAGCGPAFVDLFLEALADGGVACGLPRDLALGLAAGMTAGAARLAGETGQHPGALKDAVCSPGGSTIQGVRALEKAGFRSGVIEAVIAAWKKSLP